ncbi:MAG: HD domain-containing protein [Gemmatimonadota bacterium]|jgi:HD-GYP domain-containing protein (c-di-GMP phosphodiesterase class II)
MPDSTASALPVLRTLYEGIHVIRLHRIETLEVREALERLHATVEDVLTRDGSFDLRVVRRSLYLNGERLLSRIENYVFYDHVLHTLGRAGIGAVKLVGHPTAHDWRLFLDLVVEAEPEQGSADLELLAKQIARRGIEGIAVESPAAGGRAVPGEVERREAAKRTYERSVAVSRELFKGARLGRAANVKEVKHAVENIVEAVLENEASLGGLSTLRDYDDYSFTHSVNVCIFCVAIGRRLGLTKTQLYDLGHAALVHDIGMSRIPGEILTKGEELTPEERKRMEAHTWLGALSAYRLRDFGDIPYQSMIVAYEHHLGTDGSGYPSTRSPREPSIFSRIIAVAAAFDAATNERAYSGASPPDEVLLELWEDESRVYDPVIVKALINLLGIYPVGTVVILDTYELALVHSANSDPSFVHRPIVRLLSDANGRWLSPAPLVDLADTDGNGNFARSIIKVTSADKYGVKVSDYFV